MAKRRARRSTGSSADSPQTTDALNTTIQAAGHDWIAGDVDPDDVPQLGLQVDDGEMKRLSVAIENANDVELMGASFGAPPAVDWRNNNGDWVTPIKNQGSCGSCVSFAVCATIESRIRLACNDSGRNVDLSEAHLFYCGRGSSCDNGWTFTPALDQCKSTGVGLESAFPYTPGDQRCQNIQSHSRITAWRRILSMNERKSVIAERGPVVAGMRVFSDFMRYRSGIYRKSRRATDSGGHAVCVVGYDDSQQCWIVKNSWGPNWGENGYFRIAYNESDVLMDTHYPFYDVTVPCPSEREPDEPAEDDCRRYVPFLRRAIAVARREPRLRRCLRYYICRQGRRPYCNAREIRIVRYVSDVLDYCPQYRRPFCRAIG